MTSRELFDVPDNTRKLHAGRIPTLGGIGIFIGYIVVTAFFMYFGIRAGYYIIASSTLLFFTGIYDDLMNMVPSKKLLVQLIASSITIYFADIRITSLYGIAGIHDLPYWVSIGLTVFCCTLFINAFNFIDGIDGLACSLTILYIGILAALFAIMHVPGLVCICLGILGATLGLLFYNWAPARIYMGDTGSMFLGFTIFILATYFVTLYGTDSSQIVPFIHSQLSAISIVISLLFLPVYDALRVFVIRMSKGISPLRADRTHLHYYLLDAGFGHAKAVSIILALNVTVIAITFAMQDIGPVTTLLCNTVAATLLLLGISILRRKKLAQ